MQLTAQKDVRALARKLQGLGTGFPDVGCIVELSPRCKAPSPKISYDKKNPP